MAVIRKPENRLKNSVPAENPSVDTVQETIREVEEQPLDLPREKGFKRVPSPLSAGLRSLRSIQKRCLDIPSLIKPSIKMKKRGLRKEKPEVGEPERNGIDPQPSPLEPKSRLYDAISLTIDQQPIGAEQFTVQAEEQIPQVEQQPLREGATTRPMDQEKMGYVSPSYTMSRSITLNPQVMLANRCVGFQQDSPELEYFRVLRTQILQRSRGGGNSVMVTSAFPGEGKTLTAINLAFTFAKEFKQTALLVDCDLRRQQIHKVLGFASERGLADYLLEDCPIRELFVWPGVEKLSVISGGKTVAESSELLGSPGMRNLVTEMKERYPDRYIFFDVPPILTNADALAFAPLVDYIIVVVQAGQTPLPDVNRALGLLPSGKVLGLVMNRQQLVVKPYIDPIRPGKRAEG